MAPTPQPPSLNATIAKKKKRKDPTYNLYLRKILDQLFPLEVQPPDPDVEVY